MTATAAALLQEGHVLPPAYQPQEIHVLSPAHQLQEGHVLPMPINWRMLLYFGCKIKYWYARGVWIQSNQYDTIKT